MAKNDMNKLSASFIAGLKKYVGIGLPEEMPKRFADGGGFKHNESCGCFVFMLQKKAPWLLPKGLLNPARGRGDWI